MVLARIFHEPNCSAIRKQSSPNCSAMKRGFHRCQEHADRTFRGATKEPSSAIDPSLSPKPRSCSPSKTESYGESGDETNQVDARIIVAATKIFGNDRQGDSGKISSSARSSAHKHLLSQAGGKELEARGHFLSGLVKYNPQPNLSESVPAQISGHSWPGNARELIHELERAMVMNEKGQDSKIAVSGLRDQR